MFFYNVIIRAKCTKVHEEESFHNLKNKNDVGSFYLNWNVVQSQSTII
jgi:hypothetical protein